LLSWKPRHETGGKRLALRYSPFTLGKIVVCILCWIFMWTWWKSKKQIPALDRKSNPGRYAVWCPKKSGRTRMHMCFLT